MAQHGVRGGYDGYHDRAFAAVDDDDGDGEPEAALVARDSEVVCYYDVPEEPRDGG